MNRQLREDVENELKNLITFYGIEKVEFSISSQAAEITPVFKTVIWFLADRESVKSIYEDCCRQFAIECDKELSGEYIFVKLHL